MPRPLRLWSSGTWLVAVGLLMILANRSPAQPGVVVPQLPAAPSNGSAPPSAGSANQPGATPGTSGGTSSAPTTGGGTSSSANPAGSPAPASDQGVPLSLSYRHNFAGGYTHVESGNGLFSLNFQNQFTGDGTFYDIANPPTAERNFNIPFMRTFIYGNLLNKWEYQLSTQFFLNTFNVLDAYVGYKVNDAVNFRFGHYLTPFLYEYYAFSPAWEPVITNSPLFQLAGKRQTGAMMWGKGADNLVQYQVGVFNGVDGAYSDLDKNVDGIASLTFTPFKRLPADSLLYNMGFGANVQSGRQSYNLAAGVPGAGNSNGEPTTQSSFIGSTGIPFLTYNPDVRTDGMRTKIAPHFFWYGRASVLVEYVNWNRTLASATQSKVNEVVNAYEVTGSYFLTGERHSGDGLLGFHVITPKDPFNPSQGQYGTGAWELTGQFSQMFVSNNVVALGLVDPTAAARRLNQFMVGVNWWPNEYVRFSLDWAHDRTDAPVMFKNGAIKKEYNVFWGRVAMFF
jgi:phosphate-selective porin OprO/OprP